jgi:hypothetical protein
MARSTKPLALVQGHRTKAEKAIREKAESQLITGSSLKEWPEVKLNQVAHKEFARIKKLLKSIDKDDDLSGNIINTHCLLHAECKDFEEIKIKLHTELDNLSDEYKSEKIDFLSYMETKAKMISNIFTCDKKIMDKRKMILDISKENIMTIQSALRSIPKKPEQKEKTKMAALLERKRLK